MIEIMRFETDSSPEDVETIDQKIEKINELNLKLIDKWSKLMDLEVEVEVPQAEFETEFSKKYPDINLEEFEIHHRIVGSSPQREHEFDTPEGLIYSEFITFSEDYLDQEDTPVDGLVS